MPNIFALKQIQLINSSVCSNNYFFIVQTLKKWFNCFLFILIKGRKMSNFKMICWKIGSPNSWLVFLKISRKTFFTEFTFRWKIWSVESSFLPKFWSVDLGSVNLLVIQWIVIPQIVNSTDQFFHKSRIW